MASMTCVSCFGRISFRHRTDGDGTHDSFFYFANGETQVLWQNQVYLCWQLVSLRHISLHTIRGPGGGLPKCREPNFNPNI